MSSGFCIPHISYILCTRQTALINIGSSICDLIIKAVFVTTFFKRCHCCSKGFSICIWFFANCQFTFFRRILRQLFEVSGTWTYCTLLYILGSISIRIESMCTSRRNPIKFAYKCKHIWIFWIQTQTYQLSFFPNSRIIRIWVFYVHAEHNFTCRINYIICSCTCHIHITSKCIRSIWILTYYILSNIQFNCRRFTLSNLYSLS